MIIHTTAKLAEKLKIHPSPQPVADDLLSWRAHYVQEHGYQFVVFMNDASRLTVVINHAIAPRLKKLEELFFHNLRETLLDLSVNPDVIDRYITDLGEVTYAKNTDRKKTAQLNKNTESVWAALRNRTDDVEISTWTNGAMYNLSGQDEFLVPREKIVELLARYGLPVRKARAFDLTVRLELGGEDAVRRLRVSDRMTFQQLHKILQAAFDWHDYHLYRFGFFTDWGESPYYTQPDFELVSWEDEVLEDPELTLMDGLRLCDYVPRYRKIVYTYDYGDDWRHYIEVDDVIEDCQEELPVLLSGEGNTPPEDVGGIGGYAEFLDIVADPSREDYEFMTEWAKGQWWRPFDFEKTVRRVGISW